ncbi:ABC transporter ATP-binding protein [Brachyspira alvinipulli]|uniref:ABC transporter ATP-binding protein n=1 Tax=Brachyspira alvinipulli TaxID=84379 RepID=UPI003004C282
MSLKLVNITKNFNKVIAVNKLNIEVNQGESFSFLGPSGCGKTTTLRMIAGFEDIDDGEIIVDDKVFSSSYKKFYLPPEKRDFGMVFQAFAVWPHLKVWDNVAFPLAIKRIDKVEIEKRVNNALKHTNLMYAKDLYPSTLSGGEQQRIALARAVATNPKVMLLDEPLSNLDPKLREQMRFEIKDLQKQFGFTVIYVTHDQAEAMALSDRILVMNYGVLQQLDTPLNVYNNPINRFVFSFIGLSNFIPVIFKDGKVFIKDHESAGNIDVKLPDNYQNINTLACRPGEIDFVSSGGVKGIVNRSTYLGDMVDYSIKVAGSDESGKEVLIRVQKPSKKYVLKDGEACQLFIKRTLWYGEND